MNAWRFANPEMFTSELFSQTFTQRSFGFEDSRMGELRRRVLERVNSDQRFVQYILGRYGAPNGEPFFQELLQWWREVSFAIDQRLAERERAGRFFPKPGQVQVEQGPSPVPLVLEEVPEFLPWIRAAASKPRGSK